MNEEKDEENQQALEARRRNRSSLLLIAGIAFVPLLLAYVLYFYFPALIPSGTTNKGTLIDPPVVIQALGVGGGKWTLLVAAPDGCDDACRRALYLARQVDIGLGKDDSRVNRMFVVVARPQGELQDLLDLEYPAVQVREVRQDLFDRMAALLPAGMLSGAILLADPNGNLMMFYTREQGGEELRSDLKHLLRLSNIG